MAVFGHSGSQAPQLMHSLVMTVAIRRAIPSRRRRGQIASGSAGGSVIGEGAPAPEEEQALMRGRAVGTARAGGDHEMLAAEQEFKIARDHLQAAEPSYEGHRHAAIEHIDRALQEIREAIQVSRGRVPELGQERKAPKKKPEPSEADGD